MTYHQLMAYGHPMQEGVCHWSVWRQRLRSPNAQQQKGVIAGSQIELLAVPRPSEPR